MKVLIACEESQTVCKAFRELGHEAFSCDILPCSGDIPEYHIQSDVLSIMKAGMGFITQAGTKIFIDKWDLIIAFPPCTFISNAGACRLYPQKGVLNQERYQKGLKGKEFFMQFYNNDNCPKISIENPVSSKIFNMPLHSQEIQPYQFGHPVTKKTRLWLKGLPPLIPTNIVEAKNPYLPSGTGRKIKEKYGVTSRKSIDRSKTFEGIAKAMAEQWGSLK